VKNHVILSSYPATVAQALTSQQSSQATSNFSGSGQRLGGGSNKPLGAGSGRSLGGISDQMVGSELQGEVGSPIITDNKDLVEDNLLQQSPSRPGNEAATDVDAELSAHSSEEWDDEVPDNFEESSEEEEEQARLEKPQMEEDASPFTGSDWFDENHDLVRNTDGVEESAQAQAVEGDEKFKEAGERHAKRFRAIAKRFVGFSPISLFLGPS